MNANESLKKIDGKLIKWLRKKHKTGYRKSAAKLNAIRQANPALFYHGKRVTVKRIKNTTSRTTGDCYVRF